MNTATANFNRRWLAGISLRPVTLVVALFAARRFFTVT
jgi:hypothetical protein